MMTSRSDVVALALGMALGFVAAAASTEDPAQDQSLSGTLPSSKRMADG